MQHGESTGSYSASPKPTPEQMAGRIQRAETQDQTEQARRASEAANEREAQRRQDIADEFAEAQGLVAQPDPYDPRNQSPEQEPDAETDGTTADKLVDEPFIPESGRQTPIPPNDDYAYDPDKLGQAFEKRNHLQPPKPEKEDKE